MRMCTDKNSSNNFKLSIQAQIIIKCLLVTVRMPTNHNKKWLASHIDYDFDIYIYMKGSFSYERMKHMKFQ